MVREPVTIKVRVAPSFQNLCGGEGPANVLVQTSNQVWGKWYDIRIIGGWCTTQTCKLATQSIPASTCESARKQKNHRKSIIPSPVISSAEQPLGYIKSMHQHGQNWSSNGVVAARVSASQSALYDAWPMQQKGEEKKEPVEASWPK